VNSGSFAPAFTLSFHDSELKISEAHAGADLQSVPIQSRDKGMKYFKLNKARIANPRQLRLALTVLKTRKFYTFVSSQLQTSLVFSPSRRLELYSFAHLIDLNERGANFVT